MTPPLPLPYRSITLDHFRQYINSRHTTNIPENLRGTNFVLFFQQYFGRNGGNSLFPENTDLMKIALLVRPLNHGTTAHLLNSPVKSFLVDWTPCQVNFGTYGEISKLKSVRNPEGYFTADAADFWREQSSGDGETIGTSIFISFAIVRKRTGAHTIPYWTQDITRKGPKYTKPGFCVST